LYDEVTLYEILKLLSVCVSSTPVFSSGLPYEKYGTSRKCVFCFEVFGAINYVIEVAILDQVFLKTFNRLLDTNSYNS